MNKSGKKTKTKTNSKKRTNSIWNKFLQHFGTFQKLIKYHWRYYWAALGKYVSYFILLKPHKASKAKVGYFLTQT